MLQLRNIQKHYDTGDSRIEALAGVSIDFRESEFVSILGPSGCGKTTLLNIVGGLDRYSDGDLLINGKSTKDFKDADWDTYRNHSIGFVFQSYNLIPHQTVLSNVELALTLSGVSKAERRRRAIDALKKVGLGDQLKKKPNQMSGGQMQRVAIARAIVNDPDILLADEPTGALDTATSVQIMEILKEIARDKLVIMVTHNPELAEEYSTRIVKLRDGRVIDDSKPFEASAEEESVVRTSLVKKGKRTSMSYGTALSLSLNNLMTKKGRTFMTSFAGSIGIIGIALILALSNGINAYIALVQEDTLSSYPLTIQAETQDMSAMLGAMTSISDTSDYRDSGKIHVDDSMGSMVSAMKQVEKNDLVTFKKHIDAHYDDLAPYLSSIQYTYDFDLQVYSGDGKTQVNPTTIFDNMGEEFSSVTSLMDLSGMNLSVMSEMLDNRELLEQQYEMVAGEWPDEANELVLVISKNNQISKMTLYMLGVLDQSEIEGILSSLMQDGSNYDTTPLDPYEYDDFVGMTFRLLNTSDYYEKTDMTYTVNGKTYPVWNKRAELLTDEGKADFVTKNGMELKISGIIRPADGATATSISTNLAYTSALTDYILAENEKSEILNQQKETPAYNVLTGLQFERTVYTPETIGDLINKLNPSTMQQFYAVMRTMILENPEYSGMLEIKDAESLLGFYMLMPNDLKTNVMQDILTSVTSEASAHEYTAAQLQMLFGILNGMNTEILPGLTLSADNLLTYLPILPVESQAVLLSGISAEQIAAMKAANPTNPMYAMLPNDGLPGLMALANQVDMEKLYIKMTEQIKTMEITDEIFLRILGTLDGESDAFKDLEETLYNMAPGIDATYGSVLTELGDAEKAAPASINFYAIDFESKDVIEDFIRDYNLNIVTYLDEYKPDWRDTSAVTETEAETETGDDLDNAAKEHQIKYTDLVGVLMSSVTTIVNAISYVLIAFVSISLVVSSIMIGIITYISVLERTKEIGILRAMGASKRDITRVFNAETLIIGLCAGLIGIIFTVLICIPISAIIQHLTGIPTIAAILPWKGAVALVVISTLLTMAAGLIPSFSAAKKDPVVALRTE